MVPYPPTGGAAAAVPALRFEGETLAAGEMATRVARAAGALVAAGVRPEDRVAVWAHNDPGAVVGLLAVAHAGAVLVPLDVRLTAGEAATRARTAGVRLVLSTGHDPDIGLPVLARDDLDGDRADAVDRDEQAPAAVLFTSGTAGPGKPVVLTRRNVAAAVRASAARLGNGADDAWLAVLPLFHVGGLAILWRSAAAQGTVVLHRRFDAAATAAALSGGEVTVASLVPTMLRRVLDVNPGPYRDLRAVLLGGGPAPVSLVTEALDAGLPVLSTYGMTETSSQAATVIPGRERESLGTVGVALDGVEIRTGGDGGSAGPIEVRGAVVSPGYLGDPPRGPADWFVTGDLGRLDTAGRLVVVGRADEVIVTGGENVHPTEVEAALAGVPGVDEAAVFGVPDPEWGTVVAAAVVPDPGTEPDLVAVAAALRSRIAGYKVPRRWLVVDDLPRLATGKVDRQALRLRAGRGSGPAA